MFVQTQLGRDLLISLRNETKGKDFNRKTLDTFVAVEEKAQEVIVEVRNVTHLLLETNTYKDVKWIDDVKGVDNNK